MRKIHPLYTRAGYWFLLFIPLVAAFFYPTYFAVFFKQASSIVHIHVALIKVVRLGVLFPLKWLHVFWPMVFTVFVVERPQGQMVCQSFVDKPGYLCSRTGVLFPVSEYGGRSTFCNICDAGQSLIRFNAGKQKP